MMASPTAESEIATRPEFPCRRRLLAIGLATMAQSAFAAAAMGQGVGGARRPPPRVIPARQTRSNREELHLSAVGVNWFCTVHLPPSYRPDAGLPLVIILHGSGGMGATMLEKSGWAKKADEAGFVAVAPDGLAMSPGRTSNFFANPRIWNAGQLEPDAPRARIDDVGFFRKLLDELQTRYGTDPNRVYVTGHSNGAAMTFRLAVELSDRITAVAPVSSICWIKDPKPVRPIPTLFICGANDPLVPVMGGESVLPWGKRTTHPIAETLRIWAEALECPTKPNTTKQLDQAQYFVYGPGRDGAMLTAYLVEAQGHNWPGGKQIVPFLMGPDNHRFRATDIIWDFFANQTRPADSPRSSRNGPRTRDGRVLTEPTLIIR